MLKSDEMDSNGLFVASAGIYLTGISFSKILPACDYMDS